MVDIWWHFRWVQEWKTEHVYVYYSPAPMPFRSLYLIVMTMLSEQNVIHLHNLLELSPAGELGILKFVYLILSREWETDVKPHKLADSFSHPLVLLVVVVPVVSVTQSQPSAIVHEEFYNTITDNSAADNELLQFSSVTLLCLRVSVETLGKTF